MSMTFAEGKREGTHVCSVKAVETYYTKTMQKYTSLSSGDSGQSLPLTTCLVLMWLCDGGLPGNLIDHHCHPCRLYFC